MATKKQKRQAVQEKREQFLAEVKADGLRAQTWDQQRRADKDAKIKAEADRENRRHQQIIAVGLLKGSVGA